MTHPREVQWFVAKYVPDLVRGEPRNIGVILRLFEGVLKYRFWSIPPFVRDPTTYLAWVDYWTATMEKHQAKSLHWLPKRRAGDTFYIEQAGAKLITGEVDFEALYARLVDPSNLDWTLEDDLEPDKMPGWWKK